MRILQAGVLFQNGQDLTNFTGSAHTLTFLDCIPNGHSRYVALFLPEFLKGKNVRCFIACSDMIKGTNSAGCGGALKCFCLD